MARSIAWLQPLVRITSYMGGELGVENRGRMRDYPLLLVVNHYSKTECGERQRVVRRKKCFQSDRNEAKEGLLYLSLQRSLGTAVEVSHCLSAPLVTCHNIRG